MYERNPPQLMKTNSLLPKIPEEILFDEILARLPVKSLSRFKCVSKPWLSMIESDQFIEIHYRNSAKNPRVITVNAEVHGINGRFSLQSLLGSTEGSVLPTNINPKVGDLPLGCGNGVVCCYGYRQGRFSLWNPATRVSAELPYIEGCGPSKWGFGWDESSGAYKVFAVLSDRRNSDVRSGWVYSSKINSWRNIHLGCSPVGFSGKFLRGNLHWVDGCNSHIECFDLGREEFGRIELTFKDEVLNNPWGFPELGEIRGSLGLLLDGKKRIEVWVMKEYGVEDSWYKLLTFPPSTLSDSKIYPRACLFGEGPNGEIFVRFGYNLTVYSPKDDAFSRVTSKDRFVGPRIYVESLVSPKRILDATNTTS